MSSAAVGIEFIVRAFSPIEMSNRWLRSVEAYWQWVCQLISILGQRFSKKNQIVYSNISMTICSNRYLIKYQNIRKTKKGIYNNGAIYDVRLKLQTYWAWSPPYWAATLPHFHKKREEIFCIKFHPAPTPRLNICSLLMANSLQQILSQKYWDLLQKRSWHVASASYILTALLLLPNCLKFTQRNIKIAFILFRCARKWIALHFKISASHM